MENIDFYYLADILNSQAQISDKIIFSDLHIRSNKNIYIRKNGDLEKHTDKILDNKEVLDIIKQIIDYKYKDNSKEIREDIINQLIDHGREIDISIELPVKEGEPIFRARLNIFKTNGLYGLVLRIIPKKIKALNELNFFSEHNELIRKLLKRKEGLILVTGQTGSGKSTTMAAMLNEINLYEQKHIITIEDPIEFYHDDINSLITHREVGEHSDTKTFASGIRAAMREDPDVIQIGEMRDAETALSALQAAQTGHIVLATLHTNNAAETILRLIDMFPSDKEKAIRNSLGNSLLMILSQRLVKNVKGEYILAYEILTKTNAIKNLLSKEDFKGTQILETMNQSKEDGMLPLNQCLKRRVESGDENLRIKYDKALEIAYDSKSLKELLKRNNNLIFEENKFVDDLDIVPNTDKWN